MSSVLEFSAPDWVYRFVLGRFFCCCPFCFLLHACLAIVESLCITLRRDFAWTKQFEEVFFCSLIHLCDGCRCVWRVYLLNYLILVGRFVWPVTLHGLNVGELREGSAWIDFIQTYWDFSLRAILLVTELQSCVQKNDTSSIAVAAIGLKQTEQLEWVYPADGT